MNNYLEILGTIVGIIYLVLEYRASIHLWIVGIIMPAIYIFVYYEAGLYADFGINVYYLLAAIYGWVVWKFGRSKTDASTSQELPISHMPSRYYAPLAAVMIVSWGIIAYILANYTPSDVVWLDSFTTALSIMGMWQLAHKYVEQWLSWIVVDVVCVGLYVYKELYFTSGLYALYAIIAIFGYLKWKRLMNIQ